MKRKLNKPGVIIVSPSDNTSIPVITHETVNSIDDLHKAILLTLADMGKVRIAEGRGDSQ